MRVSGRNDSFNHFAASTDRLKRPSLCAGKQADEIGKNMEAIITQSGALYLAPETETKDRRRCFPHMRIAALDQGTVVRRLRTLTSLPSLYTRTSTREHLPYRCRPRDRSQREHLTIDATAELLTPLSTPRARDLAAMISAGISPALPSSAPS